MNKALKRELKKRWSKNGIHPTDVMKIFLKLIASGILVITVSHYIKSEAKSTFCLGIGWGIFMAVCLTFKVKFLDEWFTWHHAMDTLKENGLWNRYGIQDLMQNARTVVIDKAITVLSHERRSGPVQIEIVQNENDALWNIWGPDGLMIVKNKTEIFDLARQGV